MTNKLNAGQEAALAGLVAWYNTDEPFALLTGAGGTGKTFLLTELIAKLRCKVTFTAPTNKAVGVLRAALTTADYTPACATTFSLLGLTLSKTGEVKFVTAGRKPDFRGIDLIIVDEGSMVGKGLWQHLCDAVSSYGLKCLVLADFYQLPPVKEAQSLTAKILPKFELTEVVRNKGQILELANSVRLQQSSLCPVFRPELIGGVERLSATAFTARLRANAQAFHEGKAKAIAWRNVRVDEMNKLIRAELFPQAELPYCRGDRIALLAPVNVNGLTIACTDDEGTVESVELGLWCHVEVYIIQARLDSGAGVTLRVPSAVGLGQYTRRKEELSAMARADRRMWKSFWEYLEQFSEIRHGYATTAHRSQGSTYDAAYVDTVDILANRQRLEAFRCLYVAVSRPRHLLVMH